MKTVVYIARHGAVVNPKGIIYAREVDVPLSEEGKESVGNLANLILKREKSLKAIYSSPRLRARSTAKIIADVFKLTKVEISKDLNEVDIPGISRHKLDELELYPDFYNHPMRGILPERPENMAKRMSRAISRIVKENNNSVSVAVSHGDPIGFYMWKLRFSNDVLPEMSRMQETDYLPKGGAWRVEFNVAATPVSFEKINC